jgi:hypothetical protein
LLSKIENIEDYLVLVGEALAFHPIYEFILDEVSVKIHIRAINSMESWLKIKDYLSSF